MYQIFPGIADRACTEIRPAESSRMKGNPAYRQCACGGIFVPVVCGARADLGMIGVRAYGGKSLPESGEGLSRVQEHKIGYTMDDASANKQIIDHTVSTIHSGTAKLAGLLSEMLREVGEDELASRVPWIEAATQEDGGAPASER